MNDYWRPVIAACIISCYPYILKKLQSWSFVKLGIWIRERREKWRNAA